MKRKGTGIWSALLIAALLIAGVSGFGPAASQAASTNVPVITAAAPEKQGPAVSRKESRPLLEPGYHYTLLNDDQKLIYEAMERLVNLGQPYESQNAFQEEATRGRGLEKELAEAMAAGRVEKIVLSQDLGDKNARDFLYGGARRAFRYDHQQMITAPSTFSWRYINNNMYLAFTWDQNYPDRIDYQTWDAQIEQYEIKAVESIVSDPRYDDNNDAIKTLLAHDYICKDVFYDHSKPAEGTVQWYKDKFAYGPMVEKKGVCLGIAKMLYSILEDLGVKSFIVNSDTHAWNRVQIEDEYYEVDATWDLAENGNISHKYFNLTYEQISTLDTKGSHTRKPTSDIYEVPEAYGTKYNYDYVKTLVPNVAPEDTDTTDNEKRLEPDSDEEEYTDPVYYEVENYEYDGLIYNLNADGTACVVGADSISQKVKIPDEVILTTEDDEYAYYVTGVARGVFTGVKSITSVEFGYYIMDIDANAFKGCSKLKTISFTGTELLSGIGKGAFKGIKKKAVFVVVANKTAFKAASKMIRASGIGKKNKIIRYS